MIIGKPVAKTFAVCTIRSTPSTAHHCISWAKSYLFPWAVTIRSSLTYHTHRHSTKDNCLERMMKQMDRILMKLKRMGKMVSLAVISSQYMITHGTRHSTAAEIQELRKESAAIKQLRATLVEPGAAQRVFEKVYNHDISRLLLMEDLWKHRTPPHPISYESMSVNSTAIVAEAETSATGASGIKDQRVLTLKDSFEIFLSR